MFAQRRARLRAVGGSYTLADWTALVAQYDRSPACLHGWGDIEPQHSGADVITVDRIIPIEGRLLRRVWLR